MAFVATISLPSLLFSSICRLSFEFVQSEVIFAVILAKLALVILGLALAWLTTQRTDDTGFAYTLGGSAALLATMSDDLGIGLPMFLAFFPVGKVQDGVVLHLIILSALQSAVVNPLAFVLLGLGRARADEQREADRREIERRRTERRTGRPVARHAAAHDASSWRSFCRVLLEVLTGMRKNMLVVAVLAGAAYNILTSRAPLPWWLFMLVDVRLPRSWNRPPPHHPPFRVLPRDGFSIDWVGRPSAGRWPGVPPSCAYHWRDGSLRLSGPPDVTELGGAACDPCHPQERYPAHPCPVHPARAQAARA